MNVERAGEIINWNVAPGGPHLRKVAKLRHVSGYFGADS